MPGWSELPRNQRLGILVGVPLAIAATMGYFARQSMGTLGKDPAIRSLGFMMPKRGEDLFGKIQALEGEIATLDIKINKIPQLRADLAGLEQMIKHLKAQLPPQIGKEHMRIEFEDIARKSQGKVGSPIVLESVRITPPASGRGGSSVQDEVIFNLSLKTDMNGLIWYINEIENHERFMMVTQLTIIPGAVKVDAIEQKLDPEMHRVSLVITAFVLTGGGS